MCVELIADDYASLVACSLAAPLLRRASCPHLFMQLTLISGSRNSTNMDDFIRDIGETTHLSAHVRALVVEPSFASTCWGNAKRTTLTPCLIQALLIHLPRLTELRLDCFTWATCRNYQSCNHNKDITSRSLSTLSISHVRLRGDIGLSELTSFFGQIRDINIVDVLPTTPVFPPPANMLSSLYPSSLSVHVSLDSFLSRKAAGLSNNADTLAENHRTIRYDSCAAVQDALLLGHSLTSLKVVWTLTHARRGQ